MPTLETIMSGLDSSHQRVQYRWDACIQVWRDQQQADFLTRYIEPLNTDMSSAMRGLESLAYIVGGAQRRYNMR